MPEPPARCFLLQRSWRAVRAEATRGGFSVLILKGPQVRPRVRGGVCDAAFVKKKAFVCFDCCVCRNVSSDVLFVRFHPMVWFSQPVCFLTPKIGGKWDYSSDQFVSKVVRALQSTIFLFVYVGHRTNRVGH